MMKVKGNILFIISLLLCLQVTYAQNKSASHPIVITSPDGEMIMSVSAPDGALQYAVHYKKMPVMEASRLGLVVNGKVLGEGCSTGKVQQYKVNETYLYRGVHSTAVNKCNGAKINITSTQAPFVLEARVFNDGVAFRYLVENTGTAVVEKDTTAFVLPAGSTVWSQNNIKYYEGRYGKKKIEEFEKDELAGPPLTALLPGDRAYVAITEGGLTDFAGMSLRADGNRGFNANLSGTAKMSGNIETPWRIIEIGKDLNTLVNCDIIANVSPAFDRKLFPNGYQTDWVRPGRSVWSWLAGRGPVTLENMKQFSDLAAQLGFEYNLVDEGWSYWKDSINKRDHWDMMKELVDYSAAKGVKIWVWKAYPDRRGIPGIKEPEQRKDFFQKCKDLGIVGLKVDFFDSENQEIINFYQAALKDAAEYHLMMNFHGANKPTGESRTWPNEMTREAVRGLENRPPWAQTNTILPFTRYLAGPGDYTPVHFGNRLGEVSWA
ncbi:MAG: glycoside hydrolase family 97 catalytic domain-containing protein, partial [Flavisolibacter sp.]|nr:glycoside hydrolase family 97 catalytic domain-containing protein [Flavisolibacter sp.]